MPFILFHIPEIERVPKYDDCSIDEVLERILSLTKDNQKMKKYLYKEK